MTDDEVAGMTYEDVKAWLPLRGLVSLAEYSQNPQSFAPLLTVIRVNSDDEGPKPMRLMQLPDGDWINPDEITSITTRERSTGFHVVIRPMSADLHFTTNAEADAWVDEFVKKVNQQP